MTEDKRLSVPFRCVHWCSACNNYQYATDIKGLPRYNPPDRKMLESRTVLLIEKVLNGMGMKPAWRGDKQRPAT